MQNVSGMVTQGRRDADSWVTAYTVKASEDGITWTDVGCGGDIEGNANRGTKVLFSSHIMYLLISLRKSSPPQNCQLIVY